MKDIILAITIIALIIIIIKHYIVKKDLQFYKPKYEKIREQYLELHSKFYEPIYSIDNGTMKIEWKLKDKYKEEI